MENLSLFIAPLISAYAGQYGWAVQVVSVVGTMRLFFKPIMAAIQSAVAASESKNDDIVLGKVEKSSPYKAFVFIIDLLGSIKIKPKA